MTGSADELGGPDHSRARRSSLAVASGQDGARGPRERNGALRRREAPGGHRRHLRSMNEPVGGPHRPPGRPTRPDGRTVLAAPKTYPRASWGARGLSRRDASGWPAAVASLRALDASGRCIALQPQDGQVLPEQRGTLLTVALQCLHRMPLDVTLDGAHGASLPRLTGFAKDVLPLNEIVADADGGIARVARRT